MASIEVKATERANEKFELIVNGSREKVKKFFTKLKAPLDRKKFNVLFSGGNRDFYYEKCKNFYIVFVILDDKTIGVSDFLTKTEFNDAKK